MVKIILVAIFLFFVFIRSSICCRSQATNHFGSRSKRSLHSKPNTLFPDIMLSIAQQNFADTCLPKISCNPSEKYRSIEGFCNNLEKPGWGIPNTAYVRLLPASYADRFSQVRLAQNGNRLPSPRLIRTVLFPETDVFDFKHTLAVMEWGQIVAHDITFLTVKKGPACCTQDGNIVSPQNPPPACLAIPIPQNDPFYFRFRKTCIDMRRASVSEDIGCRLNPVQQISGVSHFLDGSIIYSSNRDTSNFLRAFQNGLLKSQSTPDGRPFLINTEKPTQVCNVANDADVCYFAGDGRVNQNTEIAVSQVMFMRLHNLLANELTNLNPAWSDEVLFQEARRIVVAILQHITYNEYLPILLGEKYTRSSNLSPVRFGHATGYNAGINPSSINEFVSAAFRSYHSTIRGSFSLVSENRTFINDLRLSDWINRPGIIQAGANFDYFLRGLMTQPQSQQDIFYSSEITNFLFRLGGPAGVDLLSMDINRGRDFGVPPYSTMRLLCGLSPVNSFADLKDVMEDEKISRLANIYSSVHDIDYLVGGLLERRIPGTLTSPSFHCVVAEAFFRYKFGDRFYYEFGGHSGAFTLEQLEIIRKFTYSMLLCLTSDSIQFAQPNGFYVPDSQSNPLIPCSEIVSAFNLNAWVV